MHKYRNEKLPVSFLGMFTDITNTDELQTRHNDYNYINYPAIKKPLEQFPLKQILLNWNSLSVDLKATSDAEEFKIMLKEKYISEYSYETDCPDNCYSCREGWFMTVNMYGALRVGNRHVQARKTLIYVIRYLLLFINKYLLYIYIFIKLSTNEFAYIY